MSLKYREEKIGLARAQELLATADPVKIRAIRKIKVDQYARDMLAGNWYMNGETIIVNELGHMVEGGHRMRAVVQAATEGSAPYHPQPDIKVEMALLLGTKASVEVEDTIDTGMPRKYGDVLAIRGFTNTTLIASVTRRLLTWERGVYYVTGGHIGRGSSVSFSEMDTFLEKNQEEVEAAVSFGTTYYKEAHLTPTNLGLSQVILTRSDANKAAEFFTGLITGADLAEDNPIRHLRERLNKLDWHQGREMNSRGAQAIRMALLIQAWNHFKLGTSPKKLQLPKGGLTNKNFPVVR